MIRVPILSDTLARFDVKLLARKSQEQIFALILELAREELLSQVTLALPHEAVGLISDRAFVRPLINQRRSAHEFMVSERQLTEGMQDITARGDRPIAVYHSHPTSSSRPSDIDVVMMQSTPKSVFVIIGKDTIAAWVCDNDTDEPSLLASCKRIPE